MDMGWHNAEIGEAEMEFVLCVLQGDEHNFPAQPVPENVDFVIRPACNMVHGAIDKFAVFSHTYPPAITARG